MRERKMFLCIRCAEKYIADLGAAEIPPLQGIAYRPLKQKCEECGKAVYGSWYKIGKGETE